MTSNRAMKIIFETRRNGLDLASDQGDVALDDIQIQSTCASGIMLNWLSVRLKTIKSCCKVKQHVEPAIL